MTIGSRIAESRKKKGLTQEYIAGQLGVSRQAVSKWEKDLTAPDTKNLIVLAELLGVSVEYLAAGNIAAPPVPDSRREKGWYCFAGIMLLLSAALSLIGFISGEYTDMVSLGNLGIWFLWYGKSPAAISFVVSSGFSFVMSLVCWIVGYLQNIKK